MALCHLSFCDASFCFFLTASHLGFIPVGFRVVLADPFGKQTAIASCEHEGASRPQALSVRLFPKYLHGAVCLWRPRCPQTAPPPAAPKLRGQRGPTGLCVSLGPSARRAAEVGAPSSVCPLGGGPVLSSVFFCPLLEPRSGRHLPPLYSLS